MTDGSDPEQELESRQAAGLIPIGRALRSTYGADNHDSLGKDLTGLMLELARVDPAAQAPATPTVIAAPPPSLLRRLLEWLRN